MNPSQISSMEKASLSGAHLQRIIEINNLKLAFGNNHVLKNITLHLFAGENLIILGKSGSGKSVLIKCIAKLLKPDSGEIKILDKLINDLSGSELSGLRKKIGFLFQGGALYDSMNVKENLEFPLKRIRKDLSQQQINEKINEVLDNVSLKDVLYKMPSQLSGGMKKRIALARTIIVDPQIMLYDEPTTGLDPITSGEISSLINEIQHKYKTSSIIITHDIACAREIADRIIMLKDGEIYTEGTFSNLEKSEDPWIRSFF